MKKTTKFVGTYLFAAIISAGCNGDSASDAKNSSDPNARGVIRAYVQCDLISQDRSGRPAPYVTAEQCVRRGNRAIDGNNTIYEIDKVFGDGRAEARYETTSSRIVLAANSYFPEVYSIEGFLVAKNKQVLANDNVRMTVEMLFSNGMTKLKYLDYDSRTFADIRDLAVRIPTWGPISDGSWVLDRNNQQYRVLEIYSNGKLYVQYERYLAYAFLNASEVSVAL
jgi:hypothetical protein